MVRSGAFVCFSADRDHQSQRETECQRHPDPLTKTCRYFAGVLSSA